MSVPNVSDQPRPGGNQRATAVKAVAAVVAVAVLLFGAHAVSKSSSSSATTTAANPSTQAAPQTAPQGGRVPNGRPPAGAPGFGPQVTGSTLTKLTQVATAKYPGSVERAMKLPDGSYEVHVIRSGGSEIHVHISKALKITGTDTRGPGAPPNATTGKPS